MEELLEETITLQPVTVTRVKTTIRNADKAIVIATTEVAILNKQIAELELQQRRLLEWIGREECMQEWRRGRIRGRVKLAA